MTETIIFMVILALMLAGSFVSAYIWAMENGQYDDLDTPAMRILKDDFKNDERRKESRNGND